MQQAKFKDGDESLCLDRLATDLRDLGVIRHQEVLLKSGVKSAYYIDMRSAMSDPLILSRLARCCFEKIKHIPFDLVCGVPYGAVPVAVAFLLLSGKLLLMHRTTPKRHGLPPATTTNSRCLLVEDVTTTGSSILDTVLALRQSAIQVTDAIAIVDRNDGARERLAEVGITLHCLYSIQSLCYSITGHLRNIMRQKKTNLCFAADFTTVAELFSAVHQIGPYICVLKVHGDIITDFTVAFQRKLRKLARFYDFLIMEDRKFADVANTVKLQLRAISLYADLATAHLVSGLDIIDVFRDSPVGMVIIAEMSSNGNAVDVDRARCMAEQHSHVVGLVASRKISTDSRVIHFTPGIAFKNQQGELGQNYRDIQEVDTDVVIVGRHIYRSANMRVEARKFREIGRSRL